MKDNIRIIYSPIQEIKTRKTTVVSFTRGNFSDHELLPGEKVYMKIVRDKEPMLDAIAKTLKRLIRKYWFSRL